jgi:hypothetical protein
MQVCTSCLCGHSRDPNLTMSLPTFTIPPLPPGTPPLLPLNTNTHAGVLLALALSNLLSLQNDNVDNLVNGCFALLPESDAFGDAKILGEGGVTDQINSAPLFPGCLCMTSLPAEAEGTADGTVSEDAKGGSIFPTSLLSMQHAYISHITSNIYIFFIVLTV